LGKIELTTGKLETAVNCVITALIAANSANSRQAWTSEIFEMEVATFPQQNKRVSLPNSHLIADYFR